MSLLLQVENEEAGLKRAGKLGVVCPLVEAHLDSRSIHRGQGSKDHRTSGHLSCYYYSRMINNTVAMVAIENLNIVSPRIRNSDQSGGIYNRLPGIYGNVNKPCPRASPSDSVRLLP